MHAIGLAHRTGLGTPCHQLSFACDLGLCLWDGLGPERWTKVLLLSVFEPFIARARRTGVGHPDRPDGGPVHVALGGLGIDQLWHYPQVH